MVSTGKLSQFSGFCTSLVNFCWHQITSLAFMVFSARTKFFQTEDFCGLCCFRCICKYYAIETTILLIKKLFSQLKNAFNVINFCIWIGKFILLSENNLQESSTSSLSYFGYLLQIIYREGSYWSFFSVVIMLITKSFWMNFKEQFYIHLKKHIFGYSLYIFISKCINNL